MDFEPVIGLEVHAQMLTNTKIFCNCSTQFGGEPNTRTCPVCLGMPGVLPVANRKVIEFSLKTALATGCAIQKYNQFARKNYFYPDLPKGYQISQFELPIATGGHIDLETEDGGAKKRIGITRIHMEEDAGKLMHEINGIAGNSSYVDLNRTGVPLMEIVSEPDIRSSGEAVEYLKTLRSILQYLEVCDGNMEQGSFRCDANISLRPIGREKFGTKVELKNMNSFRHVERAIEFEIERQRDMLEDGLEIRQETRLWDEKREETFSMRSKEEAHDYRYFPDPDLVPLVIDEDWIAAVRAGLPELPRQRRRRFVDEYKLPDYDADVLTATRQVADYFEAAVKLHNQPKAVSNWIMGDIMRSLPDARDIAGFRVTAAHLAAMIALIDKGTISGKIAKKVFEQMAETGKMPEAVVQEQGLVQVSDAGELEKAVQAVLDANAQMVEDFRGGKDKVFGFLMGQVMKSTKGKGNPQLLNDILRKKLAG
jgi:aspartyl-tRNA(Asn)/glutamyl-tRNA(Gln) amidotransferase subunit B